MSRKMVTIVDFKRDVNSMWERGIGIGNGTDEFIYIIDKEDKIVPTPVYNFISRPYYQGIHYFELPDDKDY